MNSERPQRLTCFVATHLGDGIWELTQFGKSKGKYEGAHAIYSRMQQLVGPNWMVTFEPADQFGSRTARPSEAINPFASAMGIPPVYRGETKVYSEEQDLRGKENDA